MGVLGSVTLIVVGAIFWLTDLFLTVHANAQEIKDLKTELTHKLKLESDQRRKINQRLEAINERLARMEGRILSALKEKK